MGEAMSARNKTYASPFIEASIQAYLAWIEQEWKKYVGENGRRIKVVNVPNLADLRKIQDQTKNVENPLYLVALARIEPWTERGGIAKKFNTFATDVDRKSGSAIMRNMIPVRLGFMSQMRTDNFIEAVRYCEMLMNSQPGKVFTLRTGSFSVESRIFFDPSFELPQAAMEGPGDLYIIELPCSITTWMGTSTEQGLIREITCTFIEGSGQYNIPISVDVESGRVLSLDQYSQNYIDLFDSSSPHWKGSST